MIEQYLGPEMFKRVYSTITEGTPEWKALETSDSSVLYDWREDSTYIHNPPFFKVCCCLFVSSSVRLSVRSFVCLFARSFACLFAYLSVCLFGAL